MLLTEQEAALCITDRLLLLGLQQRIHLVHQALPVIVQLFLIILHTRTDARHRGHIALVAGRCTTAGAPRSGAHRQPAAARGRGGAIEVGGAEVRGDAARGPPERGQGAGVCAGEGRFVAGAVHAVARTAGVGLADGVQPMAMPPVRDGHRVCDVGVCSSASAFGLQVISHNQPLWHP